MLARSIVFCILLCTLALSGCALPAADMPPKDAPEPPITAENFPRLDSSTSAEPILAQIACKFAGVPCTWMDWLDGERRLAPDLTGYSDGFPQFSASGTHQAYLNLIDGQADLIIVARPPSEDELRRAAMTGRRLELQPVALDAFVFMVNEDNEVSGLSTQDIRGIYTGRLTSWNEVGGEHIEIHPYTRDENSGSQVLMRTLVMDGLPMIEAPDLVMLTMMAPFYAVSGDVSGIGYSIYYYERNMAPAKERVRLLSVDGVAPSADSIRSRQYPYTTEVYAVVRGDLPNEDLASQLLDWLLSPAGQDLIHESGYVRFFK